MNLNQALPAAKQLNLFKLSDADGIQIHRLTTPSKTNFSVCFGIYHTRSQTLNFDSARQSSIEALRSERGAPSPIGKGDEEDRLSEVAASQNSKFVTECGINQ